MASYNGDRSQTMLPPIWKKPLDSAIHLKVYRNGDGNFGGKNVTLNKKQQRTFDSWLGELSSSMKLRSGAVWRVFTPTAGHRVDDFETLEDGKMIVVAGQERFKPLRYAQIDPHPKKGAPKNYDVEPGHNKRFAVSGKYKKMETQGKIIKIWANGNETHGPRTVLLPAQRSYRPDNLDTIIATVSGVLCEECNGPVEKLYFTSGIKVMSMDQISPNQAYVACKKTEAFKRAHYKDSSAPNFRTSPRLERKLPPIPRSNKTSSQSSPEHSYASGNGSENSYSQRSRVKPYRREKAKKEEEQVFHARPVKHKRSSEKTRQVDYDQDNGGVFKAKQQNNATRGARQVEDSGQTRTDLPLDRRPADTVQDEDYDDQHADNQGSGYGGRNQQEEEVKNNKKDKKGKKDQEPERQYKSNARRATPPGEKEAAARREAELEARAKREAEDRERADKARQQREAQAQKRKDKEEAKRREDEERKRKKEEEKEKREEERKRKEQEKEKKKGGDRKDKADKAGKADKRKDTSTPDRNNEGGSARDSGSPRDTRTRDDATRRDSLPSRPLSAEQRRLAEEEELAAARIQAGFRGYQTRRDLRLQQAEDSLERRHPAPLDRHDHDDDRRDDWGPGPSDDQHHDPEEEKAATTLQAGFRGYQARREVRAMRQVKQGGEEGGPDLDPSEAEHLAAAKIQASFRGHQTRKELSAQAQAQAGAQAHDESADAEAEHLAAAKIQASFRGHQTRKELAARPQAPAARDQTSVAQTEEEAENLAAAKIQASFRGHQTRKELAAARADGPENNSNSNNNTSNNSNSNNNDNTQN